ncbi:MAG: helix-turn-helix transcriptional regulator [Ruminococcaceae bacterium]|nr:helix-turn-helix transcriptional regulator [Oscillospiraceae bacterium]
MKINDNLRRARKDAGFTQEQVAQQVGISRQALSYYESGRSQPDIDMLMSLCKVYGTDINDVLYGKKTGRKAMKAVGIMAVSLAVVIFLLTFASAFMLSLADMRFPVSEGAVRTDELTNLLVKISMWRYIRIADTVNIVLSSVGYLGLYVLILATKTKITIGRKLTYTGIVTGAVLIVPSVFALINPGEIYTLQEYITTPLLVEICMWFWFIVLIVTEFFVMLNKRKKQNI